MDILLWMIVGIVLFVVYVVIGVKVASKHVSRMSHSLAEPVLYTVFWPVILLTMIVKKMFRR